MPTTIIRSIGAGRDHATVAAWLAAMPANLVTADEVWIGEVYNDGEITGSGIVINIAGKATDSTRYIVLTAAAGQSHVDHQDRLTNALRYDPSKGVAIRTTGAFTPALACSVPWTRIHRVQLAAAVNSAAIDISAPNCDVDKSVLRFAGYTSVGPGAYGARITEGRIRNSLVYLEEVGNGARSLVKLVGAAATHINNCTLAKTSDSAGVVDFGVDLEYTTGNITNTGVFGCAAPTRTSGAGANPVVSNGLTDVASPPSGWTQTAYSTTTGAMFEAIGASPDYRTKTGSSLVGAGATDATYAAEDVRGTARPQGSAFDVGAWELQISGTAPSITDQPDPVTVTEGATATFTVAASGTGTLTYQWQVNTGSAWAAVSGGTGGTTASYTTPATTLGMSGYQYRCVVTGDTAPPATSSAAPLTVNAAAVPPTVTTHPSPQSVVAGSTATFTAAFSGTPSPTVQWQRNPGGNTSWADIAGAVSLSYTTPATTLTGGSANNGDTYRAVATNAGGNAVTNPAPLTVTAASVAPSITAQPQSVEVAVGATATFSVVATGTAPLSYQWRRNGVNISGATSSAYTTPATVLGDDGDTFDVVVSNGTAPNATSSTATLTVSAGFDVDLEPVAIGNTGSGVRANQAFEFSAWRNGVVGSLAGATLVEGSGLTGSDGVATIQLPLTGVWRVEREFADGGDCVEYVTVT